MQTTFLLQIFSELMVKSQVILKMITCPDVKEISRPELVNSSTLLEKVSSATLILLKITCK